MSGHLRVCEMNARSAPMRYSVFSARRCGCWSKQPLAKLAQVFGGPVAVVPRAWERAERLAGRRSAAPQLNPCRPINGACSNERRSAWSDQLCSARSPGFELQHAHAGINAEEVPHPSSHTSAGLPGPSPEARAHGRFSPDVQASRSGELFSVQEGSVTPPRMARRPRTARDYCG